MRKFRLLGTFLMAIVMILGCMSVPEVDAASLDTSKFASAIATAVPYTTFEELTSSTDIHLNEEKWFSVTLKKDCGYVFYINASLNTGLLYFELYDKNGYKLGEPDNGYPDYNGVSNGSFGIFGKSISITDTYYIRVYGSSAASGNFKFCIRNAWFNPDYSKDKASKEPYHSLIAFYLQSATYDMQWNNHYYYFNGTKNADLKISLTPTLNSGSLSLKLYDSSFNELATLKSTGYPDYSNVPSGVTKSLSFKIAIDGVYYIRVTSNTGSDGSYKLDVSGLTSTTTPPVTSAAPVLTSAIATESGIKLDWTKPTNSSGIIGYNLYRGTSSGKYESMPITDFPITELTYTDKNVNKGTTYYYICKCVNANNTESTASNELKVQSSSGNVMVLRIDDPNMFVNNIAKEIDPGKGTVPVIMNGRTLVPIRAIIETLGGTVDWLNSEKKVTICYKNNTVKLWINSKTTIVNGVQKETDVAPQIMNNRTMLPLRFITVNLSLNPIWDGINKTITIYY